MIEKQKIIEKLKEIIDPELGINIVDLGLIYGIDISEKGEVTITMTLTTPTCPLGDVILDQIREKISSIKGVKSITVNLTFDPPWSPDKIKEEVRKKLFY
ncbi:MAG: metal-sulfur cluster assembly factor [Candidatus Nanohaloarchaeota archaeon]|nr:metal-sulfur cluster assembly factor [Candidatus Nanohaloarchaeota archaeon]